MNKLKLQINKDGNIHINSRKRNIGEIYIIQINTYSFELWGLNIKEKYRNKGLGKTLFEEALKYVLMKKGKRVFFAIKPSDKKGLNQNQLRELYYNSLKKDFNTVIGYSWLDTKIECIEAFNGE